MKLNELLHVVEKGTKIKVLNNGKEYIPLNAVPGDSEVRQIKNGIDCLVVQVE